MNSILYLRPCRSINEEGEWLYTVGDEVKFRGVLTYPLELNTLREYALNSHIVLIIPGEDVIFHPIDQAIKEKAKISRKLLTALPYTLEGKIVGEVDSLEWFLALPDYLLGISKDSLQKWIMPFQESKFPLHRIVPDMLCLPSPESEEWSGMQDHQRWIFRQSTGSGSIIEPQWLEALLSSREIASVVNVFGEVEDLTLPEGWKKTDGPSNMEVFAINSLSSSVNLLKNGPLLPGQQAKHTTTNYMLMAGVVTSGLFFFSLLAQGYQSTVRSEEISSKSTSLLKELNQRYDEPSVAIREMKRLIKRDNGGRDKDKFIRLLNSLAIANNDVGGVKILTLRFQGDKNVLSVSLSQQDAIKLKNALIGMATTIEDYPSGGENDNTDQGKIVVLKVKVDDDE